MNNNPHPLSRQLGEELSQWLVEVAEKISAEKNFQKRLSRFPKEIKKAKLLDSDDQEFLEEIFDYMLDLSFIAKENKEELADIYEAYNGL
ncbi:hypothetical protein [Capnocytophaga gingivalis]|jgi:hypothetical protein|uniref:hypothetical protein n=1 Tax=Capnocytophaga gingivalis TaxID=1017 RepID=UPI002069AB3B|nr:hypothetical protein [Capnocytophaga gingivalis]DAJ38535.1 MAG TPA: hypothetical protein [Caudoviricetes sp.]DAQ94488.1 MAG TPA: hypothetical protein [Caudoviricetes sp.]